VGARLTGADGVLRVVEQLQGAAIPASALEQLVLPARVADYEPALLDALCTAGEIVWTGRGSLPGNDGWVSLYLAESAPWLLPEPVLDLSLTPLHESVLAALDGDAALFFRTLSDRVGANRGAGTDDGELVAAVWDLVWAGMLTNDTLAPLRALGPRSHRTARPPAPRYARAGRGRPRLPSRTGPPLVAGRWSRTPERETDPTRRAQALADSLLDRHGVLTRGAVGGEDVVGGFGAVYRVLSAFEEAGRARRGYFVEGLGAAQFAMSGAVDRLRGLARDGSLDDSRSASRRQTSTDTSRALVLAATDPANPYGAALPWPERPAAATGRPAHRLGHRPGRKAGALVVLVEGALEIYVERGGRTLLSWTDEPERLQSAVDALALTVREGALGALSVERADGAQVSDSPLGAALQAAGFHATPRGLRLRG